MVFISKPEKIAYLIQGAMRYFGVAGKQTVPVCPASRRQSETLTAVPQRMGNAERRTFFEPTRPGHRCYRIHRRLVPRLLGMGARVRCLARDASRLRHDSKARSTGRRNRDTTAVAIIASLRLRLSRSQRYFSSKCAPCFLRKAFVFEISSLQSSNRCAHLHESHRSLRDGTLGWRCPRHFVPGYDRTVPPGHFATGSSQMLLRNVCKRVP